MTPQPHAPQQPQPPRSWFSKNWGWVVGGGCLVLLLCCGVLTAIGAFLSAQELDTAPGLPTTAPSAGSARVDCGTPGPDGVDCELKRTSGTTGLEACWDLHITCANGGLMVGHACGTLGAGQARGTVNMPVAGFSNQEGCDAPKAGAVQDLTVLTEQ